MTNRKKLPYGLDREAVARTVAIRALQCREEALRSSIYMARNSARQLAVIARTSLLPAEQARRDLALAVFRERRMDCHIAAAALNKRTALLAGMAEHFVEMGLVEDRTNGLRYARNLADPESDLSYSKWRHGGWYVHGVRYPSGGCGCVSNNYPDGKWRIACDDRRKELGGEGDFTFGSRAMAARAEQQLALEEWATYLQDRAIEEAQGVQDAERPRG